MAAAQADELPPQVSPAGYLIGDQEQTKPQPAPTPNLEQHPASSDIEYASIHGRSNSKSYAARAKDRPDLTIDTSPISDPAMSPIVGLDGQEAASAGAVQSGRRKGAVPDRSPLQKLEVTLGDISKEEKRARLEEAEQAARERGATERSGTTNVAQLPGAANADRGLDAAPGDSSPFPMRNSGRDFARSQSQRRSFGYDSALTGTAAAAAVGAYQASKQQAAKQYSPGLDHGSFGNRQSLRTVPQPPVDQSSQPVGSSSTYRSAQRGFEMSNVEGGQTYESTPRIARNNLGEGTNLMQTPNVGMSTGHDGGAGYQSRDLNEGSTPQRQGRERLRFSNILQRNGKDERRYQAPRSLDEWRSAQVALLTQADLNLGSASNDQQTWWERRDARKSFTPQTDPTLRTDVYDTSFESSQAPNIFQPNLMLRCGPLLRYTGIRKESLPSASDAETAKEFWRGSVMIVTEDNLSSYESVPVLRAFAQPAELIVPSVGDPDEHGNYDQQQADPRLFDLVAGQQKVSRTGSALFVKPLGRLPGGVDLSRDETEDGLFESQASHESCTKINSRDGEKSGRYREVQGVRIHAENGMTFWRFHLEVELGPGQSRIAYRINRGPSIGFWVPAKGQTMNVMFHSCNGFSLTVDPDEFSGPDPLWRDVLNKHLVKPFHCMIGGGDQIYNDAAMRETQIFRQWLAIKNPEQKHSAEFTEDLQRELELFYLNRYAMWFSQGLFGVANSQIPMVNIWDDHDIIDGFGSYPHHFMSSPVFSGLGSVAFKYYMLFQHQSVVEESEETEPSWITGAVPGPYIDQASHSLFLPLGKNVSFLGLDCRTERRRNEVLTQETYDLVFDRCRREIADGNTKHLLVLLGVPIAYPRMNFMENILTSRAMDPIKAMSRVGMFSGFINKFDGGVEVLDDLDDHWTAKHHKDERNWFIQELQELAAETSVRITILGGDVHLAAVGQFYSDKTLAIPKDHDHRYMPNIISSAIVNTPPPEVMADVLNKRNKVHHLDDHTDEDMIPLFTVDVNGKSRNNQRLLPRRNWCSIEIYNPGLTPPPTPPPAEEPRRRRSFSLGRSSSLGRSLSRSGSGSEKSGILRRFSLRKAPPPSSYRSPGEDDDTPYRSSEDGSYRDGSLQAGYGGQRPVSAGEFGSNDPAGEPTMARSNSFHRRPTNLTRRASDADRSGREGHIDLEGGLDIKLHLEQEKGNPSGSTTPYRLLVPALFYQGEADPNTLVINSPKATFWSGIGRRMGSKRQGDIDPEHTEDRGIFATSAQESDPSYTVGDRGIQASAPDVAIARESEDYNTALDNDIHQEDTAVRTDYEGQRDLATDSSPQQLSEQNLQSFSGSGSVPRGENVTSPLPTQAKSPTTYLQRRESASGPPPPSNIDELPASVQRRYRQFVHHPSQNGQSVSRSATQPSRKSPFISKAPPPLLPASEKQLTSSQKRSLRPEDDYEEGSRSVSGPAMMSSGGFRDSGLGSENNRVSTASSQGYSTDIPQRAATYHAPSASRAKTSSAAPFRSPLTSAPTDASAYQQYGPPDPYAMYDSPQVQQQQRRPSKLERYYGTSGGTFDSRASAPAAYQNNNTGPLLPISRPVLYENHRQQRQSYPDEDPAQGSIHSYGLEQYRDHQDEYEEDEYEPRSSRLSGIRRKLTKSRRN